MKIPGYDMSNHVRRYGKYIGEKIATYRTCAFDFCKVKRGREDGMLRKMHADKVGKSTINVIFFSGKKYPDFQNKNKNKTIFHKWHFQQIYSFMKKKLLILKR